MGTEGTEGTEGTQGIQPRWLWLVWTPALGQMWTAGPNQNQAQGGIRLLDLEDSPSGHEDSPSGLLEEEPSDRLQTDRDGVPGPVPGLDSGPRRRTVRSALEVRLPVPGQLVDLVLHEGLQGLGPGGLGGTRSLQDREDGSSWSGTQKSPGRKLGQGLDRDRDQGLEGGAGPVVLRLDLDPRCARNKFWIRPG